MGFTVEAPFIKCMLMTSTILDSSLLSGLSSSIESFFRFLRGVHGGGAIDQGHAGKILGLSVLSGLSCSIERLFRFLSGVHSGSPVNEVHVDVIPLQF